MQGLQVVGIAGLAFVAGMVALLVIGYVCMAYDRAKQRRDMLEHQVDMLRYDVRNLLQAEGSNYQRINQLQRDAKRHAKEQGYHHTKLERIEGDIEALATVGSLQAQAGLMMVDDMDELEARIEALEGVSSGGSAPAEDTGDAVDVAEDTTPEEGKTESVSFGQFMDLLAGVRDRTSIRYPGGFSEETK